MKSVYLFRHGETDWNAEGRIQGHLDVPLNALGRKQAGRLCDPLQRLAVDAVLTSDLSRALETARIATGASGIPVHPEPRLREMYFGKLQGLDRTEIARDFGPEFSHGLAHRALSDEEILRLGCESAEQVFQRATEAVIDFIRASGFERIAVSSHGGVIRRILLHSAGQGGFPPGIPNSVVFPFTLDMDSAGWTADDRLPWSASISSARKL